MNFQDTMTQVQFEDFINAEEVRIETEIQKYGISIGDCTTHAFSLRDQERYIRMYCDSCPFPF